MNPHHPRSEKVYRHVTAQPALVVQQVAAQLRLPPEGLLEKCGHGVACDLERDCVEVAAQVGC